MFGANVQSLLVEGVIALVAIMSLDWFKGWRGWKYYALAFVLVFAFHVIFAIGGAVLFGRR
jgi:hypothetical protein